MKFITICLYITVEVFMFASLLISRFLRIVFLAKLKTRKILYDKNNKKVIIFAKLGTREAHFLKNSRTLGHAKYSTYTVPLCIWLCVCVCFIKRGGRGKYVFYWAQSNLVTICINISMFVFLYVGVCVCVWNTLKGVGEVSLCSAEHNQI